MNSFGSLRAFLDMGGYAAFVWPSYALTLAVMGLNVFWAKRLIARSHQVARRRLAIQEESRLAADAST
jgi:heme exporter protein CcmD